uniref:Phosphoinositide phospholipase C n=1 Tax=Ciona savignyi TaxID=51511 RepID=H2Y8L4_CIOSA
QKFPESRCFSIVTDNSSSLVLNFVASTNESAAGWIFGLNLLSRRIKELTPRLQHELYPFNSTFVWELFNSYDADKNGFVTFKEAKKLLRKSGVPVTTYTRHHFFVSCKTTHQQYLDKQAKGNFQDFPAFSEFYEFVTTRSEISELFHQISADKFSITSRELYKFIQKTQRDTEISEADCERIIQEYEVDDRARLVNQMSQKGFTLFLNSKYSELFNWRHEMVYQDMKQPLSHYFIASSHNTYLTGDQLKDPSSTDAYMNVLLKGCRCVELDCWDGPDGDPLIYHGYTLTSKIKFKDVIKVIGKYAFEVSIYPLILSIENHCSVTQQEKMAYYLKTILGSELLTMPLVEKESVLPSPHALIGKILLKGKVGCKKLPTRCENDDVSDEDEAAELQCQNADDDVSTILNFQGTTHKLALSLSDLVVYCKSVKFKSLTSNTTKPDRFADISSFTEAKAFRLAKNKLKESITFHELQLSRTYPAGTRTDSSNYDPLPLWNAGFQVVALNYQTRCDEMEIYDGKFRQNGSCGFILKPTYQRGLTEHCVVQAKTIQLKIISGHRLTGKTSNFDESSLQVEVLTSGDPADTNRFNTFFSGFDPKWNDEFIIYISKPDLAMVKFMVKTQNHERIGQNTMPFTSIAQGYRYIPMLDRSGARIPSASLFVFVEINDA